MSECMQVLRLVAATCAARCCSRRYSMVTTESVSQMLPAAHARATRVDPNHGDPWLGNPQAASAFSTPTLGAALCILLPDGGQVTSSDPGSGTSGDFDSQLPQSCALPVGRNVSSLPALTPWLPQHIRCWNDGLAAFDSGCNARVCRVSWGTAAGRMNGACTAAHQRLPPRGRVLCCRGCGGGADPRAPHAGHLELKLSTHNPQPPLSATEAAAGELALVPPMLGTSQRLLNRDHKAVYFQVPLNHCTSARAP
jgi:hypothetical protein